MNKSRDLVFFYPEPRTQQWGHVRGFSGGSCGWYVKSQHLSETASTVFSARHPVSRPSDSWSPECVGEWLPDNKSSTLSFAWVCQWTTARQQGIRLTDRVQSPEECAGERLSRQQGIRLSVCVQSSERLSDNKASASSSCPETGVCQWTIIRQQGIRLIVVSRDRSVSVNDRQQCTHSNRFQYTVCWTIRENIAGKYHCATRITVLR